MIICENLSKLFNNNPGIKDINVQFSPGLIYGIIGLNGSGKTTLLNCIEGLYTPTTGFVSHNNIKTTNEKEFTQYRRKIAYLPSDEYLYPGLTCIENIELASILRTGENKLLRDTEELIRYFEIDTYMHKRFKDCSTGMKKKVQIVVSLTGEVDTIIWDEPNNGLDIISNLKIKTLLNHYKSKNKIIIISSHVIEYLENFVDTCVLLQDGKIIENSDVKNITSLENLFLGNVSENTMTLNITHK